MPSHVYANYGSRAIAYIYDFCIVWLTGLIGIAFGALLLFVDSAQIGGVVLIAASVIYIPVMAIYNSIFRQGKSGQTFGKHRMKIKLVRDESAMPVGPGMAAIRVLAAWLFNSLSGGLFMLVDLIFPAFDSRKQRVIDKMLQTVVVDVSGKLSLPTP